MSQKAAHVLKFRTGADPVHRWKLGYNTKYRVRWYDRVPSLPKARYGDQRDLNRIPDPDTYGHARAESLITPSEGYEPPGTDPPGKSRAAPRAGDRVVLQAENPVALQAMDLKLQEMDRVAFQSRFRPASVSRSFNRGLPQTRESRSLPDQACRTNQSVTLPGSARRYATIYASLYLSDGF
jgi:hypothetical protein